MFRLSFRSLLGLSLVVVNVGLAAVVATFAYRAAHDAMVEQALHSVSLVAESRQRELTDLFGRRQQRLDAFLRSLESLCGERNARGRFGFEEQCLRTAINGLHFSERAISTRVNYSERSLFRAGAVHRVRPPFPTDLARIEGIAGNGYYAMRGRRGDLTVDMVFDLEELNAIFADPAGARSQRRIISD